MIIPLPHLSPGAVKLPTRAPGLKRPCGGLLPTGRTFPTRGPYSALLRVGLAIPSRLPGPWWALTPPFHHRHGPAGRFPCRIDPAPWQSFLCGAFPGVAPAGRYPAPLLHGVRTFLEAPITRNPAITQPSARHAVYAVPGQGSSPRQARIQSHLYHNGPAKRRARSAANPASTWSAGPVANGRNRSRNADSTAAASASG